MQDDLPSPILPPPNVDAPAAEEAMNVVQHTGTKAAPGFGDPVALGTPSRKLGRIIAGLGLVVAAGAALWLDSPNPRSPKLSK